MENNVNVSQQKLQLSSATSIRDEIVKRRTFLHTKLLTCQRQKAAVSRSLSELCMSLSKRRNRPPTDSKIVAKRIHGSELADMKMEIVEQKRAIVRLQNSILAAEREICEIKEADEEHIKRQQEIELQSLQQFEQSLKEECRELRIKLAQHRQRQWYKQPTVKSSIQSAPRPQQKLNTPIVYSYVKPSSYAQSNILTSPKSSSSIIAGKLLLPLSQEHKQPSPSGGLCSNDHLSAEDTSFSSEGCSVETSKTVAIASPSSDSHNIFSNYSIDADSSIENLEARKEANNRHFKFFTNF